MSAGFTHLAPETGAPRMVDVGAKAETLRTARARALVRLGEPTWHAVRDGAVKKGDAGACPLVHSPLTVRDMAGLFLLIVPTLLVIAFGSWWFWDHNISYVSFFFPPPYTTRR